MKLPENTFSPSRLTALLFVFVSSLAIVAANADELAIPVGHQGAEKTSLARPKVGMTGAAVESKFGAPSKKTAPVGNPPISSWEYPHYNVYFESDRVIHSVLKPFNDEATAPAAEPLPVTGATPESTVPEAVPAAEPAPVTEPAPAAAGNTEATN